jgi:hypothetical protein
MGVAWDASRPVPWQRLTREWLVYVAIMAVIFLLLFRDRSLVGIFAGLLASGPLYLAFGYVLAKFGYQRKTFKQLRAAGSTGGPRSRSSQDDGEPAPRPKPPPTRRTGGGAARPGGSRKKRR